MQGNPGQSFSNHVHDPGVCRDHSIGGMVEKEFQLLLDALEVVLPGKNVEAPVNLCICCVRGFESIDVFLFGEAPCPGPQVHFASPEINGVGPVPDRR